ncbi:hypothetical protein EB052_00770 [bacterium]|nr:hypothetical protein [bacterium]
MNTKHLPLIVAISLPVLFIIIISLVLYVPAMTVNPSSDFIYSYGSDTGYYSTGWYRNTYKVSDGHLVTVPAYATDKNAVPGASTIPPRGDYPPIYRYDVKVGASHEISLDTARGLVLDAGPSSPDGYSVSYEYGRGNIFDLFGSNSEASGYFISKDGAKKRLNGIVGPNGTINQYSYGDQGLKIVGWVK